MTNKNTISEAIKKSVNTQDLIRNLSNVDQRESYNANNLVSNVKLYKRFFPEAKIRIAEYSLNNVEYFQVISEDIVQKIKDKKLKNLDQCTIHYFDI